MSWYTLTDDEADRLNPPDFVDDDVAFPDAWLPVGVIPCPRTRLGWFVYHLVHGLWMRYPLHKVLGYALANTEPEAVDHAEDGRWIDELERMGDKEWKAFVAHAAGWREDDPLSGVKIIQTAGFAPTGSATYTLTCGEIAGRVVARDGDMTIIKLGNPQGSD